MRIVETELIPVVVPTRPDAVNSAEWGQDGWGDMEHILIRVRTDEGIVGLGETQRGVSRDATRAAAESLRGLDPLALCLQDIPLRGDGSPEMVGGALTRSRPRI